MGVSDPWGIAVDRFFLRAHTHTYAHGHTHTVGCLNLCVWSQQTDWKDIAIIKTCIFSYKTDDTFQSERAQTHTHTFTHSHTRSICVPLMPLVACNSVSNDVFKRVKAATNTWLFTLNLVLIYPQYIVIVIVNWLKCVLKGVIVSPCARFNTTVKNMFNHHGCIQGLTLYIFYYYYLNNLIEESPVLYIGYIFNECLLPHPLQLSLEQAS